MHVATLEFAESPSGANKLWSSTKLLQPTLLQIETAIRRLDRGRFPFAILWRSADESKQVLDGSCDALEVMGGDGAYWLAGTFEGYFQRRIDDPMRGDEMISVWTSDQGFEDAARHVLPNVEDAIRAARYFALQGGFEPSLAWEQR